MMLIAMLIWGGKTIFDFSLTMLVGMTAGTYSSIFVAAALWFFWERSVGDHKKSPVKTKPVKA
jgi:preprotein translocase subunit SecF